jgi:hypothetical protein
MKIERAIADLLDRTLPMEHVAHDYLIERLIDELIERNPRGSTTSTASAARPPCVSRADAHRGVERAQEDSNASPGRGREGTSRPSSGARRNR